MENKTDPDDIVQLIPAPGWYAIYHEGVVEKDYPLMGWGLTRNHDVVPLEPDDKGYVDDPRPTMSFVRIEYRPER